MRKLILHLCADLGSDSRFYQLDDRYEVVLVGEKIGVQNYRPNRQVHGIIANPVCTEFSTATGFEKVRDLEKGMFLVNHCLRIIDESNPVWWSLENPANGRLKELIGAPSHVYQPWEYGSPWTKKTALWGNFKMPHKLYKKWQDVPKNKALYQREGRSKPGMYQFHKSAIELIPEFYFAKPFVKSDADLRSLCSQGFAEQFYLSNQ